MQQPIPTVEGISLDEDHSVREMLGDSTFMLLTAETSRDRMIEESSMTFEESKQANHHDVEGIQGKVRRLPS